MGLFSGADAMIQDRALPLPAPWPLSAPRTGQSASFDALAIRAADVILAASALIFFAPLMILIGITVLLTSPGPLHFSQQRLGRGGRIFHCLKFRTMVVDAPQRLAALLADDPEARISWDRDHKLKNDPRITLVGGFLRRSSLDELPQLLNVLRGDMSLVGPRPITLAEAARYGRYISEYLSVVPGITGLWQISGRNDLSYRRRVALDVAFARSRSIGLYLKIAVRTVPAVFLARGSY